MKKIANSKIIIIFGLVLIIFNQVAYAQGLSANGTIPFTLQYEITTPQGISVPTEKTVRLLKLKFTPELKHLILLRLSLLNQADQNSANILPLKVELGMNHVPVMDQGAHGTCVSFAVIAALDAALGKGDYASILCSLELGNFLSGYGYFPSGWDDTNNDAVFEQVQQFGIINKNYQHKYGCASIKNYPAENPDDIGKPMSLEEFHPVSEDILNKNMHWFRIFSLFGPDVLYNHLDSKRILNNVKEALAHNERVVFGFFIDTNAPLAGRYKVKNDTWLLTPTIINDIKNGMTNIFGHEEIITGYDDNAIAYDANGTPHKGLLMLRNSWGFGTPAKGNDYMTYDYFMVLANEASKITLEKQADDASYAISNG